MSVTFIGVIDVYLCPFYLHLLAWFSHLRTHLSWLSLSGIRFVLTCFIPLTFGHQPLCCDLYHTRLIPLTLCYHVLLDFPFHCSTNIYFLASSIFDIHSCLNLSDEIYKNIRVHPPVHNLSIASRRSNPVR